MPGRLPRKTPATGTSTTLQRRHKTGLWRCLSCRCPSAGPPMPQTAPCRSRYRPAPAFCRGSRRAGAAALFLPGAAHKQHPQQKDAGQPAAAGQKGVCAHVAAADALRHKGRAPDEGGADQQQCVAQLFFIHSVKSSLVVQLPGRAVPCPSSLCILSLCFKKYRPAICGAGGMCYQLFVLSSP